MARIRIWIHNSKLWIQIWIWILTARLEKFLSRYGPDPAGFVINWPSESGSVSRIYRSADLEPPELFGTLPIEMLISFHLRQ
jgi:hypothetical protein